MNSFINLFIVFIHLSQEELKMMSHATSVSQVEVLLKLFKGKYMGQVRYQLLY